jgi:transposase
MGLRGVVVHLLREGAACHRVGTSKVCRKILESESHLGRFAEVEGAAPGNNAAEGALRHGLIWRKPGLSTASEAGSRFVERLLSLVETSRQRGQSVAAYLTACFQAKRCGQPIPSPPA